MMERLVQVVILSVFVGIVSAGSLELRSTSDLNLTRYGVDAERCHKLVYRVRSCWGHYLNLLDSHGQTLVKVKLVRGITSTMSVLPTSVTVHQTDTTSVMLSCNEYRWFWINWGDGNIAYGIGKNFGVDVLFETTDPTGQDVHGLGTTGFSYVKLGETGSGRFERLIDSGKFSDGLIAEVSTGLTECADRCAKEEFCGMFSYNTVQGMCAIFNSRRSSFNLTSHTDWRSWKMLYCLP